MPEEIKDTLPSASGTMEGEDTASLLQAISDLKQNSVSRSAYDKLVETNRQLTSHIVNGTAMPEIEAESDVTQPKRSLEELRKIVLSTDGNVSNLEYAKATVELRQQLIDNGERDPFLPFGQGVSPTEQEVQNANMFAAVLEQCIEESDGDDGVFQALFTKCIANDRVSSHARRKY